MTHYSSLERASKGGEQRAALCATCTVRESTFCNTLTDEEAVHFRPILSSLRLNSRSPIVDEGEPAEYLFNITDGVVKLYKQLPDGRRQVTGFLFPGDFLGITFHEEYAFSAETVTRVTLCRFSRPKFEIMIDGFPTLKRRLLGMASNELVQAHDQILLLGCKSAQEKIVAFLFYMSERNVKRGSESSPIYLPMNRTDIADYLGLTTETVSRIIARLKRDGFIRLQSGGLLELSDADALRKLIKTQ